MEVSLIFYYRIERLFFFFLRSRDWPITYINRAEEIDYNNEQIPSDSGVRC